MDDDRVIAETEGGAEYYVKVDHRAVDLDVTNMMAASS